ncbi:MAG: VanZ family protein [Paramuribaculum sp.]|nr:VanZ family protein [Barnesiella sp.]MDE6249713.1 VanZ family protein [Paramuribaculum sp.]MDE7449917.1 VanZ family protein [Paramuribaculum sp.]
MKSLAIFMNLYRKSPRWLPTLVVTAVICYLTLSSAPLGDTPITLFEGADKVVHFLMFGALAGVLCLDWSRRSGEWIMPRSVSVTLCALLSALAGVGIEWLQSSMEAGRSAEWADGFADGLGAVTGAFVAGWMVWRYSSHE